MVALFELGARRAADAVRNGEQTAEGLAEALLARCAAASPLNAFISLEVDRLRATARAADQRRQRGERLGPLHGVPIALKDNIDTADFPTTGGTPALAAHRPKRQIILSVSGRLRLSTSCTRLRLPMKGMRSRGENPFWSM